MVDLATTLAGVTLPNPVMTASGCAANGRELHRFFPVSELGAFVTKTVMRDPRSGRGTPRMAETASGMLNSIGLQGPGIEAFAAEDLPWLESVGARVLVSVAGNTAEEFGEVAARLAQSPAFGAVVGVEANISCPNVANRGLVFACDAVSSERVVAIVRDRLPTGTPVFAKLTPDVTDIVAIAAAALAAGADGLTMINTLLGMVIDTDRLRPQLAGVTGGLSGPAVRPVAVRALYQVTAAMRAGTLPHRSAHRGRGSAHRPGRARAARGRRLGGPGGHGDLQRPQRAPPRARRARGRGGAARLRTGRRRRRHRPREDGPPMSPTPFGDRLRAAMDEHGPFCPGIDPHAALLGAWGLPDTVDGLERFAMTCVEAFGGTVACVKPQSAFFERFGSRGVAVLERTLGGLREAGTLTLLDAKRGDIGTTMGGYAQAYLSEESPARADALTLSPYLGYESLRPALDLAAATGRGVFVLTLTSNPEGASVQHAVRDGRTVAASVVEGVAGDNATARAAGRLGSVGMVVGATVGAAVHDLGLDLAGSAAPLLAPGLGAQGGTPATLRATFGPALAQVLGTSSREVLAAGPDVVAVRRAARAAAEALRALGATPQT